MKSNDIRPLPKPIWHDRFGARQMQLQPRMNAVTAAQHAVVTYPDAADLESEVAAEIFAAEEAPDEGGAPQ
jgi:hypothetical protein